MFTRAWMLLTLVLNFVIVYVHLCLCQDVWYAQIV
jgi:hypothetical protein